MKTIIIGDQVDLHNEIRLLEKKYLKRKIDASIVKRNLSVEAYRLDKRNQLVILLGKIVEYLSGFEAGAITNPVGGFGFFLRHIESLGADSYYQLCWLKEVRIRGSAPTFNFDMIYSFKCIDEMDDEELNGLIVALGKEYELSLTSVIFNFNGWEE